MTIPTTSTLGCLDLLRPFLLETPAPADAALRRSRAVRALGETVLARLQPHTEEIIERMAGFDYAGPWVLTDGHYVAHAAARTQQVVESALDAATLLESGRTAAVWAVLDLGAQQLRRLLDVTEVWDEGLTAFGHPAAGVSALLGLAQASVDRGVPLLLPGQLQDYLAVPPLPVDGWEQAPLALPVAAGTVAAVRAGIGVARCFVEVDGLTRPDLAPAQVRAASTVEAQQRLQAVLAVDLVRWAATALCRLVGNFVAGQWLGWIAEITLAAGITEAALDPDPEWLGESE